MIYDIDIVEFENLMEEVCDSTKMCGDCPLRLKDCCYYDLIDGKLPYFITEVK